MLSVRDLFRRGIPTHVALHARLERKHADSGADVRRELKNAGFNTELILANVRRLEKLVGRLEWKAAETAWSAYTTTTTYSDADAAAKAEFVGAAARDARPQLVWDIGCNEGTYSRLAAAQADSVVAFDADVLAVEQLYRALRAEGDEKILPLVVDVADPSPGLGWRGRERGPLEGRGAPELTLCLALIHHVVISGNIPVAEFLDWLRSLGTALVIEFPTPEDPMVQRLLVRKREHDHPDYRRDEFERLLGERFDVERSQVLSSGTRVLYRARPRV